MKIKIFCLLLFLSARVFTQENLNIQSVSNIKKFADYLFCQEDYLRSALEYERILFENDDSVKFKLGIAYREIGEYEKSETVFEFMFPDPTAKQEYFNTIFHRQDYQLFRNTYDKFNDGEIIPVYKLYLISYFFTDDNLPELIEYEKSFGKDQIIRGFYERKINPPYKSELTAGILSAIIPGVGKIYTEQYGDGITAFISTGLLAYLSYSNFKADHEFRGWLFGGLTALFYAGNIYGSAASARIFNAGVKINLFDDLNFYLNEQNYFMPDYNFCR